MNESVNNKLDNEAINKLNKLIIEQLDFVKMDNLIPAIIQDINTLQVLMLGYVNGEALSATLSLGKVTFYSRSKKRLWTKGETSGNFLYPKKIIPDCDNDAILILVEASGNTCHLGEKSCFKESVKNNLYFINELEAIVTKRYEERPANSYTSKLFDAGINRIAQKVGEEGLEIALAAATNEPKDALLGEVADLLYHLLVLLQFKGCHIYEAIEVLENRHRSQ